MVRNRLVSYFQKKKKTNFGTNSGTGPYGPSRKINYNIFIFENNFSIKMIIAKVHWATAIGKMIMKLW